MKPILTIIAAMLLFTSCKTHWSDTQRSQFIKECTDAAVANIGQDKAKEYCSCMQQKIETKYPDYQEAAKFVQTPNALKSPEMTALVQNCLNGESATNNSGGGGIFGNGLNNNTGTSGNWSKDDEDKWMNICATTSSNKELCSCVLQKLEMKFTSYDEMNTKGTAEEGRQLALQCQEELNGNSGTGKGSAEDNNDDKRGFTWPSADEQKFMNTCVQNAMKAGADEETSNEHCKCILKKIEARYHDWDEANTKMTKDEVKAIEQQCVQERKGGFN